ncbi:MAG: MFS transporter [Cyclobacteriaceae bacterium]|nr:MFS transporter [Cyclobacteriaceae bacterium]
MEIQIKRVQLFNASCVALVVTALTFATRAGMIDPWIQEFGLNATEVGWIVGTAFWGFTLAMVFGGPLVDVIGMNRILIIAFTGHVVGILLTIVATGFWSLYISTLFIGISNGMVEAACNPLIATIYPDDKTKRLNHFHVWFPGGIVIGGLMVYFLNSIGFGWRIHMALMLLPTLLYGFMFIKLKFPQTERVLAGVSTRDMYRSVVSPLFIFMACCMLLTAMTELGTNQWIAALLENVGVPAILLLVWVSGIMAIGRQIAGPIVHRLSPSGVLLSSAILAGIGLVLLSYSNGYWSFAAAAVFALGITYFWPTMLGFVSENVPKSGALGLAIMGGIGFLGGAIAQPVLGSIFDMQTSLALPEGQTLESLRLAVEGSVDADILAMAKLIGGKNALRYVAILPVILTIAFGYLYFTRHRRQSEKLDFELETGLTGR